MVEKIKESNNLASVISFQVDEYELRWEATTKKWPRFYQFKGIIIQKSQVYVLEAKAPSSRNIHQSLFNLSFSDQVQKKKNLSFSVALSDILCHLTFSRDPVFWSSICYWYSMVKIPSSWKNIRFAHFAGWRDVVLLTGISTHDIRLYFD